MSALIVQEFAQASVERMLNTLPEGILIAWFAWALLRVLRKQNSGTRFAVWFVALLTVAALALPGVGELPSLPAPGMTLQAISRPISTMHAFGAMRPALLMPGRWALFAFVAWACGAGSGLARLSAGLFRLRTLRQSCTPISAAKLHPAVQVTVDAIRANGAVTVATSDSLRVPSALGFWHRTIILPAWALHELPPEDLNVILLHEYAHLRRWDDWTNLIQKIVRALFFFHPAVWWIESRLAVEREMACDDAVLAQTANPRGYAACLVSLLEKNLAHRLAQRLPDKRWSMAQAAVHRAREASLRLAQILDANRPAATRVWKPALAMVAIFSFLCFATLSSAPHLVAFERNAPANGPVQEYDAALRPSLNGAPGVPARPYDSPAPQQLRSRTGRSHAAAGHRLSPPSLAAQANAAPPRGPVVPVSDLAGQEIAPQFQTLLFVETTQYLTPDSSVWSVQVWRVTFVSVAGDRLARAPQSNSI